MKLNGWDRALKDTADGKGLIGHAGAVLLRKAADQLGLTAGLSAALRKKGSSPLLDRGTVLASLAVAIALGAASMSDIALLAHLSPVLGAAPSGPTVRRALDLAGTPRMLDRIARARAKAREHAWKLIEAAPAGFPWLAVAGKTLRRPRTPRRRPGHPPLPDLAPPARLARHARQRTLAISPDWPWAQAFLTCWQRLRALPAPA
jgi:hypothetical protein